MISTNNLNNMELSATTSRKLCYLLYFSGFMDLFGVAMLLPLMPSLIRELGASPTLIGIVGSIFGGVQLVSSPIMGKYSDYVGRYTSIILSLGLSGLGYCIIGFSSSILLFAVARVILGCFKHGQTLSKAYIYDVLASKDASAAIGRFHSISSIGFILGPTIGGHLSESEGGIHLVAFCSAILFLANAVIMWLTLPRESIVKSATQKKSTQKAADISNGASCETPQEKSSGYVRKCVDMCRRTFSKESITSLRSSPLREFWDLFLINFFAGLSVMMFRTNFSLNLREKHMASRTTIGHITSYTAAVSALFGLTVGYISKRYKHNDAKLYFHTLLLMLGTLACLSLAPSIPVIVIFLTPLSFSTSITRVCSSSLLVNLSGKQQVAAIMGLNQSINSVSRMVSPTVVGLIQEWSMDGAAYVSVLTMLIAVALVIFFPQDPQSRQKRKVKEE